MLQSLCLVVCGASEGEENSAMEMHCRTSENKAFLRCSQVDSVPVILITYEQQKHNKSAFIQRVLLVVCGCGY